MTDQAYQRDKNGIRLDLEGGINTMLPTDLLPKGFPFLQNVRRNLFGRAVARAALGANINVNGSNVPTTIAAPGPTSMVLMNDPYYTGPPGIAAPNNYVLVIGAAGVLYVNAVQVATGLTAAPCSFVLFRPNTSPQPWCYVANIAANPASPNTVSIPSYISSGYGLVCGMLKVRSNSVGSASVPTCFKTGVMEPQSAPVVSTGAVQNSSSWVSYRYCYRSKITGALSNPSPESPPQLVPQSTTSGSIQMSVVQATWPQFVTLQTTSPMHWEAGNFAGTWEARTINGSGGLVTGYVIAANFGLTVPSNVTINGVQVAISWNGQADGTGFLQNAALFYQGQAIGAPKSPGAPNTQALQTVSQGGDSDLWGATLTPAIVNDPTFGFGTQVLMQESGGTDRSFIYGWTVTIYYTTVNNTGSVTASLDPQVDTIDIYRQTNTLTNFTYVMSVPNSTPAFTDTLSDLTIASNPNLQFDNYEPFPSIDLPRSGTCTVTDVNQGVTSVAVLTLGSAQTNGTYVIASSGGGGAGATVQVKILGGQIVQDPTSPLVLTEGSGYTSPPTFTVSAGGTPGTLGATISPIIPITANITSTAGDIFNKRWLPGTIILIGDPNSSNGLVAYLLYNRPSSTTQLIAYTSTTSNTGFTSYAFPPAGVGLTWQIAEPSLAAEPSPAIWGPTPDNAGSFYFGLDPNNPGDLLWSKGNNFDSAPDTNRQFVTSPSEPLQNGVVTSELSAVFSTDRFWLIYPNFADAIATVTGVEGQQWTLIQSAATRGLYMRYAIGALGAMIAWRSKDCVCVSMGGGPERSITEDIDNLFPQGGQLPSPVTIAGNTVWPPDDTKPWAQTIVVSPEYIFYNYQDVNAVPRTLVYDLRAKGWIVDTYSPTVNCHLWAVGPENELLTGCTDGTVRALGGSAETGTAIIATRSENAGDSRALKRIGDTFYRAMIENSKPVTLALYKTRFTVALAGYSPTSLTGTGTLASYVVDFTAGFGNDVDDIGALLSWSIESHNVFDLWQPDWTELPEIIQDRPTDWTACGSQGNKFIQGALIELDTFNAAKALKVERSDDSALIVPTESPLTVNGQTVRALTFNPPFQAHMLRMVSTDGVPWRLWNLQWIFKPFPESVVTWQTEMVSHGLKGWLHIPWINLAYESTATLTLTLITDQGQTIILSFPSSSGAQTKQFQKLPRNKFKLVSYGATSSAPFNLFEQDCEIGIKEWGSTGPYQILRPFGGPTAAGAEV